MGETKRLDSHIQEEVSNWLADAPDLDASTVDVRVSLGAVVLDGVVGSRFEKRRAEELAEAVQGVIEVDNRLRVQRGMRVAS